MRQGLSIREFARREGCSDMLVRKALKRHRLTAYDDGSLDPMLVGTPWCEGNAVNAKGANSSQRTRKAAAVVDDDETPARAANRLLKDGAVDLLNYSEALRVKENYLALLRQLEYEERSGELISLREAETVLFETFRAVRDTWLSWPIKTAPLVAADLGLSDIDRLAAVLAEHVHRQLAELGGEPEEAFGKPR